ncbi:MAG: hypothetical protein JSU01_11070, partial [Bacteroidetes bacterium]|nr:hypothetical protein [Bacteroidota bacterium]
IEVGAGNSSKNDGTGQLTANTDGIVDGSVKNKTHLQTMAYRIKNLSASMGDNSDNESPDAMAASLDEQALNAKLAKVREQWAANLRSKFSGQFLVEKVSPWQTVKAPYQPKESNDNTYNVVVPINGVEYGAFIVTNLQSSKQAFIFQFSGAGDVSDSGLFTVPFVTSGNAHNETADPLVPVANSLDLEPGESRMCIFKISGKKAGQDNSTLKIQSGASSVNLSLNINVTNVSFGSTFSLNANAWAYLNYPLVADRKAEAIADLHAHHINTMVVPPNVLPIVGSNDFSKYNNYIAQIKSFKNICLFMNLASGSYKNSFKTTPFLSDQWKANFLTWYSQIVQGAKVAGISASQLYVYPYDEVRGAYVRNSADFLTWLRQAHPEIKTFGTLVDQTGCDKIMPLLTVSTLLRTMKSAEDVASANAGTHDLWLYETNGGSEALSAYAYYRLIAWEAFVYGFQGVGFWNYADATGKLELDAYDGANSVNYSVIYHGAGTEILSSRRWEAFKLGIEDYELLKKYAAKAGLNGAKDLAKSVLDNPNDVNMATRAREQMLKALAQ